MRYYFYALYLFLLLAGGISAVSCTGSGEPDDGGVPLQISAEIQTRVTSGCWEANDRIGVFITDAATSYSIVGSQYNKLYITDGSGTFSAGGDGGIYLPADGSKVKMLAYYPYSSLVYEDMLIPVNITVQTDPSVDFMTATQTAELTKDTPRATLKFYHRLTKLNFTVRFDNSVPAGELSQVNLLIDGMDTKAVYDLAESKLEITPSNIMMTANVGEPDTAGGINTMSYSAVVFPRQAGTGVMFILMLPDGKLHTCTMDSDLELAEGTGYEFSMSFTSARGLEIISIEREPRG